MEKLRFLGIGGATNVLLGGNCAYIKSGKKLLLIDVCESATEKLKKLNAFDGVTEVYIAITHTHFDHVAGLGVLLWYCNLNLNIKTKIIYGSTDYMNHLQKLLKVTGVSLKFVDFIKDTEFEIDGVKLKLNPTTHTPSLLCHGIMFYDDLGQYYYTGDTKDISYIRKVSGDKNVKTIYCEVATKTYDAHIRYEDIADLDKEKLVLMHFDTVELYNRVIKDGFKVAEIEK